MKSTFTAQNPAKATHGCASNGPPAARCRLRTGVAAAVLATLAGLSSPVAAQGDGDVPVTIKELDVESAIQEFKAFQQRLSTFRDEIGQGQGVARETAQILDELRATAGPENNFNEGPILEAVSAYVGQVIQKQVDLVDFLESQRYRIAYYANKMASSVSPEDMALLFGTVEQNDAAITLRVQSMSSAQQALADFIDTLPPEHFDREGFRPLRGMTAEERQTLNAHIYRYQQERNSLELSKKRLQLVRSSQRGARGQERDALDIDADLLVGQMFGALDRIRLQMSMDLVYLEQLLGGYARSSRTQEILDAFQNLMELQGDLQGPSPELAGVLDWLQDSSTRRISLSAANLARPGLEIPRSTDLLREAYQGARGTQR